MQQMLIYTDGGARGNPGPAGAGAVIVSGAGNTKGKILREISDYLGEATNNIAEYEALIRALETAQAIAGEKFSESEIEVRMDSELIVRQMQGKYKVKAPELKPRFLRVQALTAQAKKVSFTHVPREKNKHADRLVNQAIDRNT